MIIFIDTNLLYRDPFWRGNYAKQILNVAREKRATIIICDVVIKELRFHFRKQILTEFEKIEKSNLKIKRLTLIHKGIKLPKLENYLIEFDTWYSRLFKIDNIIRVSPSNDHFGEILNRAIERIKPFTENKSEFKDAVIWTCYYKYAKHNNLNNCFLLTNNSNDFAATGSKTTLHPDLCDDFDDFSLYPSFYDFYEAHKDFINAPIIAFTDWINKLIVNETYVLDLLVKSEDSTIRDTISAFLDYLDPSDLSSDKYYIPPGGYLDLEKMDYNYCSNIKIDIIKDYAIISGLLHTTAELDIFQYLNDPRPNKSPYPYLVTKSFNIIAPFNFILNYDEKVNSLQIEKIDLKLKES
ncbi:MAG: PIN domain-containing protein [Bacteroidota bacterium]